MKIITSIIAMCIGLWGFGLFHDYQRASALDFIICGLICVIINLICFSLRDTKALRAEIAELKNQLEQKEKDKDNDKE